MYAARAELEGPYAVINADDFYGKRAFQTLGSFLGNPSLSDREYALVGYALQNTLSDNGSVSRGICHSSDGTFLDSVEEHTGIQRVSDTNRIVGSNSNGEVVELADDARVSLNCWGFPAAFSRDLEARLSAFLETYDPERQAEFYLPFAVDALLQMGSAQSRILDCSSRWLGVTHREDLPVVKSEIEALFEQGEYTAPLW